jgi:hypothetical protein
MNHHVTLAYDPSYPHNTPSNFYSVLDSTLYFQNNTEVAITELYYPNDYNVPGLEFIIRFPNYMVSEKNADIEQQYLINDKRYTREDETRMLVDVNKAALEITKKLLNAVVEQFKKIDNQECPELPEKLTSAFIEYKRSVEDLLIHIDAYSPAKTGDIIDALNEHHTNLTTYLNKENCNNREINKMLDQIDDIKNNIDNYKNPMYEEKKYFFILQDRDSLQNVYDALFRTFSSFFYTSNQRNKLIIKPEITMTCSSDRVNIINQTLTIYSNNCVSIVKNYIIYLDIIEAPIVSNCVEQIIKIVKPEGCYKDYISKSFDNPHYIKVNKNIIYKIQVQIKDQNQQYIDFNCGPVTVKLHFRKIKA